MTVETTGFGVLCLRERAPAHSSIVAHFINCANENFERGLKPATTYRPV
jgi:hypothetical protein